MKVAMDARVMNTDDLQSFVDPGISQICSLFVSRIVVC